MALCTFWFWVYHNVQSATNASPSATVEKVKYKKRISRSVTPDSATSPKRSKAGKKGALKRILRPTSIDPRVERPVVTRNSSRNRTRGDQAGRHVEERAPRVKIAQTPSTSNGRSHGKGTANPII
jgi:hypothetical protein